MSVARLQWLTVGVKKTLRCGQLVLSEPTPESAPDLVAGVVHVDVLLRDHPQLRSWLSWGGQGE